ncbi:hypothetical protein GUITHDRAFT_106691 [Guillardia theta CCMP2712]|uniref:Potassium channel domain-containing protein n=1 Tax=Guillardia theta (strain CCMP2712) TaxID=905079 RepID=L1JH95_GUITC|nr:hypothetical protein GUITHDRAFT_106691 [Guillardia theta CCMP2712]EKX47702.1 hypothetical protein GUITHDRAFT_106691 [Guillardia theta CCMP2712]|eukprot:XP_005834682.1 hypothetical protein GUITHDRAFT_106691 [Guillardia theta CCMP2712]
MGYSNRISNDEAEQEGPVPQQRQEEENEQQQQEQQHLQQQQQQQQQHSQEQEQEPARRKPAKLHPMEIQEQGSISASNVSVRDGRLASETSVTLLSHRPPLHITSNWRRNRAQVDKTMRNVRRGAALCGLMGCGFAVACDELILYGVDAHAAACNLLKAANTIATCAALSFLVYFYLLNGLLQRVNLHLRHLKALDTDFSLSSVALSSSFWAELVVCGLHLPPMTTFELGVWNWNNFILYRGETILAVINTFRLYLLWPVLKDQVLQSLPKRHTISSFTNIPMGSSFVVKKVIRSKFSLLFITILWLISVFLFAFCILTATGQRHRPGRSTSEARRKHEFLLLLAEFVPAEFEKKNDLWYQNAVWAMFVTSTTIGYGDILCTTHMSRFVAILTAGTGLILVSLMTAAFQNALQWTEEEIAANLVADREIARLKAREHAARLVQIKWKGLRGDRGRAEQRAASLRAAFMKQKKRTEVDLDDCLADSVKVDQISSSSKKIHGALLDILKKTTPEVEHLSHPRKLFRRNSNLSQFVQGARQRNEQRKRRSSLGQEEGMGGSMKLKRKQAREQRRKTFNNILSSQLKVLAEQKRSDFDANLEHSITMMETKTEGARASFLRVLSFKPDPNKIRDWTSCRKEVETRQLLLRILSCVTSLVGLLAAVLTNELVLGGTSPRAPAINALKWLNSIATVACCIFLYSSYVFLIRAKRIDRHVQLGKKLDLRVPFRSVARRKGLWVELLVCLPHAPPHVAVELELVWMGNVVVYAGETVGCVWNALRMYLTWSLVMFLVLREIPMRSVISHHTRVSFDALFCLKRLLNRWTGFNVILIAWFVMMIIFGYLYRSVEFSFCLLPSATSAACQQPQATEWEVAGSKFGKQNDVWLTNSFWFIFVTMTTVGYGEQVPTTILGRLIALLAATFGILCASLTTAALGNLILFTPAEFSAIAIMEREKAREDLRVIAANMIRAWWLRQKGRNKEEEEEEEVTCAAWEREADVE